MITFTVIAVLAALAATGWFVARRRLLVIDVVGDSMSPTYASGDRLLVRRTRRVRTGDVVIALHQQDDRRDARTGPLTTTWLVKRLVALPGDAVPESVTAATGGQRSVPTGMRRPARRGPGQRGLAYVGLRPLADIAGVVVTRLGT